MDEERNVQLDGLRCFAVLLVLWEHAGIPTQLQAWGDAGVRLFFVLSAFLITRILLGLRDTAAPLRTLLRTFYQRRFLRILPPYLLLLGVLLALGAPTVRRDLVAHLLYLSNWRFIEVPWRPPLGHLWTLSVEEQFYLGWPLLVLLAPRRALPWLFGGAIGVALATRPLVMMAGLPTKAAMLVTSASFDALGAGALLAWHVHAHREHERVRRRVADACLFAGAVLLVATLVAVRARPSTALWLLQAAEQLGSSLVSVWCVQRASAGFTGLAERVLESRAATGLGRVSYGVYLVQTPVCFAITQRWGTDGIFAGSVPFFLLASLCSVALAALSWHFVERPIGALKRHVPYPGGTPRDERISAPRNARATPADVA